MKVYIAGPMRGIPLYNFPAFDKAHFDLRRQGHDVKDPAKMDRILDGLYPERLPAGHDWNEIPEGFDFEKCVTRDIEAVRWCDAIYMLDGWEKSTGARAEKALAEWCGKRIIYQTEPATNDGGEVRVVDAKTGGEKGRKLARFELLPWDALWEVAEHYGRGAAKYADRNWERGLAWSLCYAAAHRHMAQFWQGRERTDAETGGHHLAAAVFHLLAILAFDLRQAGTDDRPGCVAVETKGTK